MSLHDRPKVESPDAQRADTPVTAAAVLEQMLAPRLDSTAAAWWGDALASLHGGGSDRDLYRCVSLVSRRLGKALLAPDAAALAAAAQARPGWDPSRWTVDQAARVRLLLASSADAERLAARLDQLCATADVDELVALYGGLPLYPDAPRHRARAAEGLRSNMVVVYQAVAHNSPYPAEQLADGAWNQMVLKALFVGSALYPIQGLDQRANPALARMLGDYAHERWAARRTVGPELWRCVGPFADAVLLADLGRVLDTGSLPEQAAAVLALRLAADAGARQLLARHAALNEAVAASGVTWANLQDFHSPTGE